MEKLEKTYLFLAKKKKIHKQWRRKIIIVDK